MDYKPSNREKKVEGRRKREEYVQGKRSYLHALVNSIARRAEEKGYKPDRSKGRGSDERL